MSSLGQGSIEDSYSVYGGGGNYDLSNSAHPDSGTLGRARYHSNTQDWRDDTAGYWVYSLLEDGGIGCPGIYEGKYKVQYCSPCSWEYLM